MRAKVFLLIVVTCIALAVGQSVGAETAADSERIAMSESGAKVWGDSAAEITKAVATRSGKTELSKLAASMKPGTWAELKTDMPERLWRAPKPSKGLHIGTWSDDGHWDSRTGQFLFFGVRQTRKLVAYSEETNAWRVISFHDKANAPKLKQQYGHEYAINGLDPVRSHLYRAGSQYDIIENTWAKFPKADFRSMVFEYFTAMDALVSLERARGVLWYCRNGDRQWTRIGKIAVHGYHSLARDNPFRQEVLFAGGNDSQRVVVITKDGKPKRMKDFPIHGGFTIRTGILTVDPQSGRYLFKIGTKFVEFDSMTNEYRLIADFTKTQWPFSKYEAPLVAFIPEYGVTMWADRKVMLYKHKVCTGEPLPDAPPDIDTKKESPPQPRATDAPSRGIRFRISRSRPFGPPGEHENTRTYSFSSHIWPCYFRSSKEYGP